MDEEIMAGLSNKLHHVLWWLIPMMAPTLLYDIFPDTQDFFSSSMRGEDF